MTLLGAGLLAGAVSTVAGMGGGLLLVPLLSWIVGPLEAVAVSAPALLTGNIHRLWLFRADLETRTAGAIVLGAAPGAMVGAFFVVMLDPRWITAMLFCVASLALARGLGWIRLSPPRRWLIGAATIAGAVASASGCATLVPPLLLSAGLRGRSFVATASACALAIHASRLLGYGIGGRVSLMTLLWGATLAMGILVGNLLGRNARGRIGDRRAHSLTYGVLGLTVVTSAAQLL